MRKNIWNLCKYIEMHVEKYLCEHIKEYIKKQKVWKCVKCI